ncbi:AMP-binding protein [Actinomadura sp. 9N215]|uniref:AMP-binding protein n=1 Tax=Actinomadura sp. 9N215 TaxID=3375150 RepID=UPI0037A5BA06
MVPDLLRSWAQADGERSAVVVDGGGSLTYSQWETRSNATAQGLLSKGIRLGDRVGLYFENADWLDFVIAYIGVLKAGAIAVPLSSRLADKELTWILADCEPSGVIHGRVRPASQEQSGWRATLPELTADCDTAETQVAVQPEDLADVLYTSGTTGRPKGVACTHGHAVRPLLEVADWYPEAWRRSAQRPYLHANSVSTAAGQLRMMEPLGPLGMTTVALPAFDAERFCALIAEHRAAVVQMIPAMALTIMDSGAVDRHDLSSLRVVVFGCAPLPANAVVRVARALPECLLVNLYELSEARHVGTYSICGEEPAGSVGRPRGATEVRIVDGSGRLMPTGQVGEICLRWRGLAPQSYFRDRDATATVFGDGWTRTGDGGYLGEDGRLRLVDRLKDVIISGGHSVSSVEVEDALCDHDDVAQAAVFGRSHASEGEEVCAAVVLRGSVEPEELRRFVRQRLADHKVPRRIWVLDEIPRNRSGKPLKRELRERFAARVSDHGFSAHPGDDITEIVCGVWRQVLGVMSGPADDFLALGGNSLSATQVVTRLRDVLGVELTVGDVFEQRTPAGLAAAIRGGEHSDHEPLRPIRPLPRPPELSRRPLSRRPPGLGLDESAESAHDPVDREREEQHG